MSSDFLDLSQYNFTSGKDVVNPGKTIYNPAGSTVKTLRGNDEIIGYDSINSDFGFGVFVGVATSDASAVTSVDISDQANLEANGIDNKGSISTNRGRDIVKGTATANISVSVNTASEAIASAKNLDSTAIAQTFGSLEINAIANGINNSGSINTGDGSDSVDGDITSSITASATATTDATAIVQAVAQAPVDDSLTAFAAATAQSIARASVVATGIKNVGGEISTGRGGDHISATATSDSATYSEASSFTLTAATPENQALAISIADAIAEVEDKAIAIDNQNGLISLGRGGDSITATASATDTAIAINNQNGTIRTGDGADKITAYASGNNSYGIVGGDILTGNGRDEIATSNVSGGANIKMGAGQDTVKIDGFGGNGTVNGGRGNADTFEFGLSLEEFESMGGNIILGSQRNNEVTLELNGESLNIVNFEQFSFGGQSVNFEFNS